MKIMLFQQRFKSQEMYTIHLCKRKIILEDLQILLIVFILAVLTNIAIAGEFAWLSGYTTRDKIGNYGEKGIPHENNLPGSRESAVTWIDSSDNLYLFGGIGYATDASAKGIFRLLELIIRKFE